MVPVHNMKANAGVEVQLHSFLISALDGDEWSAWRSDHFTPDLHWASETFGDVLEKRKIPGVTELSRDKRHARMWSAAYFCADGLLYWFVYGLMCLIQSLITLLCLRGTHSCRPRRSLHCWTSFKVEGRYVNHRFQISTNSLSKCLYEFSKIPGYALWVWNLVSHSKGTRFAGGVGERVVMGMFEPKREEVTGDWRRLHKEQLRVLYCSPNVIRVLTIFIATTAQ